MNLSRILARLLIPEMVREYDQLVEDLAKYQALYRLASEANRAAVQDMLARDTSLVHRLDQTTALLTELCRDQRVPQAHRDRCNLHLSVLTHHDPA